MSEKSDQRNSGRRLADAYRLAFAGVAWAIFLALILSNSLTLRERPAAYGSACLLAAYTIFALVIWHKNSR